MKSANNKNQPAEPPLETIEQLQQRNLRNIQKKLRKGRTLTSAERDTLAGVPPRGLARMQGLMKRQQMKAHTEERALFWGCRIRSMQIYKEDGLPVDDPAGMVKWFAGLTAKAQRQVAPPFRARLMEERAKLEGIVPRGTNEPDVEQADKAEFDKAYKASKSQESDNLAEIKKECAYYLFKMQKARERRDHAAEADAGKMFKTFSEVIHDCELRAQKLGRDLGDLVPRASLELPAKFIGYHLLRCCDAALGELVTLITQRVAAGAFTAEDIRGLLESVLLDAMVAQPIIRACEGDNGAAPPVWLVTALKGGLAEVVETQEATG